MTRKRPKKIIREDSGIDIEAQKFNDALIILFSIAVNIILFFSIAFQTLMPTTIIILIYLILPPTIYLIFKIKKLNRSGFKSIIGVPTTLNAIFLFNYFVSFSPHKETYYYQRNTQIVTSRYGGRSYSQKNTEITLQNNVYENFYGIRIFLSEENIKGGSKITYTFKTGILGIRVMTDYGFS